LPTNSRVVCFAEIAYGGTVKASGPAVTVGINTPVASPFRCFNSSPKVIRLVVLLKNSRWCHWGTIP
jgi:hypothetical protein